MAKAKTKAPSLGELIDQLYVARSERLALAREVDEKKSAERLLHTDIIAKLKDLKLVSSSGSRATATIKPGNIPIVKDWTKLHAYIKKTNSFELLQRRISVTAYEELIESGAKGVPGVEDLPTEDLSVTKSSKGV